MKSIADHIKAFDLLPKDNSKFEGFQHDQVCILGDDSGYCEEMELRSGKTNGRKTSQAIYVVIQGKEDGGLYYGIARVDGTISPGGMQEVELARFGSWTGRTEAREIKERAPQTSFSEDPACCHMFTAWKSLDIVDA